MTDGADRRVLRSREAIFTAFRRLIFEKRYDAIRIAELIAAAGVGRATFYEHFRGKDDVLLSVTDPILIPLANAASGRGAKAQVAAMLGHLWEKRSVGRVILNSATGAKLERHLAAMILDRLDRARKGEPDNASSAMQAAAAAAAQMAMLRLWVKGKAPCTANALAGLMIRCAALTWTG